MEGNYPQPSLPENLQEEVVDAIVKGDLAAFKKCQIDNDKINLRLLHYKELKPVPKYNKDQNYINIKSPTILMFAILCEQDEIVEYILDNCNPDVSIKIEGQNCLHLAAMIKDPKCLKILLQHEWIQENIDEPVDILDSQSRPDEKTTALHIAVSNRRYANTILLIDNLPKPRWLRKNRYKKSQNDNNKDDDGIYHFPADPTKKSDSGKTPLLIAVSLSDYNMVRIILYCNVDPYIPCNDVSPIQLARDMQKRYQETSQEEKSASEKNEIDRIVDAFQNGCLDTLDDLKKELAPELLDEKD